MTPAYHHQANGQNERSHRFIHDQINARQAEKLKYNPDANVKIEWHKDLPKIAYMYNCTSFTYMCGLLPYELRFKEPPRQLLFQECGIFPQLTIYNCILKTYDQSIKDANAKMNKY